MHHNEFYLILFPCLFIADYVYNAILACFMRSSDGKISSDSRFIYSMHLKSMQSPVFSRILFLRDYRKSCVWLVLGQLINFIFAAFYIFICLFFIDFAIEHSVLFSSIHFIVMLAVSIIIALEHLIILNNAGQLK